MKFHHYCSPPGKILPTPMVEGGSVCALLRFSLYHSGSQSGRIRPLGAILRGKWPKKTKGAKQYKGAKMLHH